MANSPMGLKDRPYNGRLNVKNGESSSAILQGVPVCFPLNLTADGYGVVLPSTATATAAGAVAGIAVPTKVNGAAAGEPFDIIAFGFCNFTRLVRGTRAATTDAWPTFPAIGIGDILTVNTVANAVAFSATANGLPQPIQGFGLASATATGGLTLASTATQASNAYPAFSGQTAYTMAIRTWLRLLS